MTTSEIEHKRVTNGAKVLHDYFNHWAWRRLNVDFRAARTLAGAVGCKVPDFKSSRSLPSLSDHLRDIGNLENISNTGIRLNADESPFALNLDAFELWKLFYKNYEFDIKSEEILEEVKKEYRKEVWQGGASSKRTLNHGVCGGLILLQAATFWNELFCGLKFKSWEDCKLKLAKYLQGKFDEGISEQVFEEIKKRVTKGRIPAHIRLRGEFQNTDWIKELWATASVAIHDYVTKETWNFGRAEDEYLRINLKEDPLAYLAIIVDILQEWDRYTVLGESAFAGSDLLQSYETYLYFTSEKDQNTKFFLAYPKRDSVKQYCKEICNSLNRILVDFKSHIVLLESAQDEKEGIKFEKYTPPKM